VSGSQTAARSSNYMNRPYIVFSGAQSTGKTTLIKPLISMLETKHKEPVKYLTEVARSLAARGYTINKEATNQTQRMIEDEYFRLEKENWDFIKVADRSIIDRYAYAMMNGGSSITEEKSKLLDWYDSNIEAHCKKYSHIFFIPICSEVPLKLDGVRSPDPHYREEIDKLQRHIIDVYNIKVFTINETTPETRFKFVKKVLEVNRAARI
jgi:nicotinamide riboside kinase